MKLEKQLQKMKEVNSSLVGRVTYCRKAKRRTIQIQGPEGKWLCLHR
jgi:hypothetical protein